MSAILGLVLSGLIAGRIAKTGFPLPAADRRIGCVDGLRGFLALSVVVHHFFMWVQTLRITGQWENPPFKLINQLGAGSVGLFFMTTGLVFYPRVLAGLRATVWREVYITRIFRLFPLVVFSVLCVIAVITLRDHVLFGREDVINTGKWMIAWSEEPLLGHADSGRVNAYVLWSLRYEWIFYLGILPCCALLMDIIKYIEKPSWIVPLIPIIIGAVGQVVIGWESELGSILLYMPLFGCGMLAYEIQNNSSVRSILSTNNVSYVAIFVLILAMLLTSAPYRHSLPLFAMFFICVACGNSMKGILRSPAALVLGECSFGIYLLHGIVLDIFFVDGDAIASALPLSILIFALPLLMATIVLISALTYLSLERPAMRYGRWVARGISGKRSVLGAREIEVAP